MVRLEGIVPAVLTPFHKDETLNKDAFKQLLDYLLDSRVHGLFVCGSAGEFWALSKEEKKQLFEVAVDYVNQKKPVYAGTGAESTREALELTKIAEDIGVDAVSIITPYYVNPTKDGLFDYYSQIASKVDVPILLYNNPGRTGGVNIDPDMVRRLTQQHSNIVGIKDSSGDLTLTNEFVRISDSLIVFAGRDTLIFPALISGTKGAIAVTANVVPNLLADIYENLKKAEIEKAKACQQELAPLRLIIDKLGPYPLAIKEAINMIGIPVGPCRSPIVPLNVTQRQALREVLLKYDVTRERLMNVKT